MSSCPKLPPLVNIVHTKPASLTQFKKISVDDTITAFRMAPAKTSSLDFVPTYILTTCRDVFGPLTVRLANLSFDEGRFSYMFKQQIFSLCLLDLSAAFDILDHFILLTRQSTWFGRLSSSSPSAGFALIFRPAHLLCLTVYRWNS